MTADIFSLMKIVACKDPKRKQGSQKSYSCSEKAQILEFANSLGEMPIAISLSLI